MNIAHMSGGAFWSPAVITCFSVALLALVGLVLLLLVLDKRKSKNNGIVVSSWLAIITIAAVCTGLFTAIGVNMQAADANFAEKLKSDYGVTTQASFNDVRNSATFSAIVVFEDKDSKFEVRPHLTDDTMTFFRVDNGTELKPKS